jgi:hypothetical protein
VIAFLHNLLLLLASGIHEVICRPRISISFWGCRILVPCSSVSVNKLLNLIIKSSQATSIVRWLSEEKANILRTISHIGNLKTRTEMAFSSLNHLIRLVAREDFIIRCRHESYKSYELLNLLKNIFEGNLTLIGKVQKNIFIKLRKWWWWVIARQKTGAHAMMWRNLHVDIATQLDKCTCNRMGNTISDVSGGRSNPDDRAGIPALCVLFTICVLFSPTRQILE